MTAERFRMDVISTNIANVNTVQTPTTQAYRRQDVVLEGGENGPRIVQVMPDNSPLPRVSDPGNQAAGPDGKVDGSNVQPVTEMVDMMGASRAYEANVQAFNAAKGMIKSALSIGKV
jgi:flagellar basal-body rod protein FlgC